MKDGVFWVLVAGYCALGLVIAVGGAVLVWRSLFSPLRPLPIPLLAWRQALRFPIEHPGVVAGMAAIAIVGTIIQEYFENTPGYDELTLVLASIGWQAAMAAAMAALAVPLVRGLIALEPYANFAPEGLFSASRSQTRVILLAALVGLAVWLAGFGLVVGLRAVLLNSPEEWRRPIGVLASVFNFGVGSLMAFILPALISGYKNPVFAGVATAARNCGALYLVAGLMALAPMAYELLSSAVFLMLLEPGALTHVLHDMTNIVFNICQFLAIQASAAILFRCCVLKPVKGFVDPDGEPAVYADYRPY